MNKLLEYRTARRMTQKALADAAGISQPFLYDLECGHRNAKPETWERIAEALGCTVDELREPQEQEAI